MALLDQFILPFGLILISNSAFAQVPGGGTNSGGPLSCINNSTARPPTLRAEGMTELIADIVLTCTGGQALPPGSAIPTATFTVSLVTAVASRILFSPNISEAMLLIDEPGAYPAIAAPVPGYGPAASQSACDNYTLGAGPGGCVQYGFSSPDGVPIASSSPTALTPPVNVFFGAVMANQVVFSGIPVLAPATAGIQRVFRITNLRANVASLCCSQGSTLVASSLEISGSVSVPVANPVQINGFFQSGLQTAIRNPANTGPLTNAGGTFIDPVSQGLTPIAVFQFTENFPAAFRSRTTAGDRQTAPGETYNSESGLIFKAAGSFQGNYPGLADFGTRLKAVIRNLPAGVKLFASTVSLPENTLSPPAVLVTGETDPWVNGAVPAARATANLSYGAIPLAELPVVNGTATALWEVVNTDPVAIETLTFGLWAAYSSAAGLTAQGTAFADLSFAPTRESGIGASIPLFTDSSVPSAILSIAPTACQYSVARPASGFSALPGTVSAIVTAPPQCSWSATSDYQWIHVQPGSGAGSGPVSISVDANLSAESRSGLVWAAGQRIFVSQPGISAPTIAPSGIVDPWTFTPGIAPGAWISIYGSALSAVTQQWQPQPNAALPTTLGGVTVLIDGLRAPLSYVSPTLIDALVPAGVHQGAVPIMVSNGSNQFTAPVTVSSFEYLPAIYSIPTARGYYATAVDPASGDLLGNPADDPRIVRPVRPGETIDLYAIGLGPTTPAFPTDTDFTGSYAVAASFRVLLGNAAIAPNVAALVAPGLYQVRIAVPPDTPSGDRPIRLDFGAVLSAPTVYLTIQP